MALLFLPAQTHTYLLPVLALNRLRKAILVRVQIHAHLRLATCTYLQTPDLSATRPVWDLNCPLRSEYELAQALNLRLRRGLARTHNHHLATFPVPRPVRAKFLCRFLTKAYVLLFLAPPPTLPALAEAEEDENMGEDEDALDDRFGDGDEIEYPTYDDDVEEIDPTPKAPGTMVTEKQNTYNNATVEVIKAASRIVHARCYAEDLWPSAQLSLKWIVEAWHHANEHRDPRYRLTELVEQGVS
jgi:hypothetical protein